MLVKHLQIFQKSLKKLKHHLLLREFNNMNNDSLDALLKSSNTLASATLHLSDSIEVLFSWS